MSMGAVAATYLSAWCVVMLLALLWHGARHKAHAGQRIGREVEEAGETSGPQVPLIGFLLSSSFVAAIITGCVVYLAIRGMHGS